jgi:hypothetical protein
MGARRRSLAFAFALAATLALSTAAVASAAFIVPPAGTPDLSSVVLQPGDLGGTSRQLAHGYVTPFVSSLSAEYTSAFGPVSTIAGVSYDEVTDAVGIGPTTTGASAALAIEGQLLGTRAGHKLIARDFVNSAPRSDHVKAKDVSFGPATSAGVGASSAVVSITYRLRGNKIHQVILAFQDGDAYVGLSLTGKLKQPVPQTVAITLAMAIDDHVQAVLAGTGATGTTGVSGVSGTTGVSG